jgi:tRNA 2-thiouridine synthesizing protein A
MTESASPPDQFGLPEADLPVPSDEWDAGYMGCGEVIILLRMRMRKLKAGDVLKLTSYDLGAPEDLPAWCRMTGRRLLRAHHPHYWIEAKIG